MSVYTSLYLVWKGLDIITRLKGAGFMPKANRPSSLEGVFLTPNPFCSFPGHSGLFCFEIDKMITDTSH